MQERRSAFYLGGLSCGGYRGYFQEFIREFPVPVLIEGGFSSGAQKILKAVQDTLAEAADPLERIFCPVHEGHLDALSCGEFCIVNAAVPHELRVILPTAVEQILPLYDAYSKEFLVDQREELTAWTQRGENASRRAARYLTAAASLIRESEQSALVCTDLTKAEKFGEALVRRYLPAKGTGGCECIRLMSAVTPEGLKFLSDALKEMETLVVLEDEYGAVSDCILRVIRARALERGWKTVVCPCAVRPRRLEHVLIPELSTAFVTSNRYHETYPGNPRRIHCVRFSDKSGLRARRVRMRFNRKTAQELMMQACGALHEAKDAQNMVEAIYSQAELPDQMEKLCCRAAEIAAEYTAL